jgi:hypothetical protein
VNEGDREPGSRGGWSWWRAVGGAVATLGAVVFSVDGWLRALLRALRHAYERLPVYERPEWPRTLYVVAALLIVAAYAAKAVRAWQVTRDDRRGARRPPDPE